ncbi:MAG: UDP-N-acetylmuramoyl-L-alanine--D-glutamate ligase [Spirochaetales bacterium]|nr:UDP-N-acetylmuramoyl-L-alanine--D-glutamate ligase [Spirochaetales bacterium]
MNKKPRFDGLKVTIMGLGLNGGGLASAAYFARRGAQVTATDLRSAEVLAPSIQALEGLNVRFVLGRHDESDFSQADLVVKNPAVRPNNPYLALAKRVETDLSLFLREVDNPLLAVTGSKGKSTVATALHAIWTAVDPRTRLGGNIAVSPLSFVDEMEQGAPVVLELSSWQLADLRGLDVLHPKVAVVTNLLWDHMNVYSNQEAYARDKAVILEGQSPQDWALLNVDQSWGTWFAGHARARVAVFSAQGRPNRQQFPGVTPQAEFWLDADQRGWGALDGPTVELLPQVLKVPGSVFRTNCLAAAAAAFLAGCEVPAIRSALADFRGVPHRMENFRRWNGVDFFDDTAATIPEAAVASFLGFKSPVRWIAGGTDKNVDLAPFEGLSNPPAQLVLLGGSATERLLPLLKAKGWSWDGPFTTMSQAVDAVLEKARPGDVVLLSPGAASFELFKNEFDRGRQFQEAVTEKTSGGIRP